MRTAGVDLAAESKGTAVAVFEWGDDRATLTELTLEVDDAHIVGVAGTVDKLGIDCAFGWPDEFVRFVTRHAAGADQTDVDGGMDWRRTLAYRATDREVRRRTGRWPLSVSTDRLGLTAMRCAGLLARLAESGVAIDRSGAGLVVEVYPGASLRMWGRLLAGYRTDAAVRAVMLAELQRDHPWMHLGDFGATMVRSADAFDAVVAALAARSAALGLYERPKTSDAARAAREGWIALPEGPLDAVIGRQSR